MSSLSLAPYSESVLFFRVAVAPDPLTFVLCGTRPYLTAVSERKIAIVFHKVSTRNCLTRTKQGQHQC